MIKMIIYTLLTILSLIVAKLVIDRNKHPKGLFHLFFAEMWERFSFYGMRALLVLYIVKDFMRSIENNEEIAYGVYAAYGALVYATPLLGGVIADRLIGYRKAIMLGGILMAIGHFFMAFPSEFFFYGALALLIAGNGFFKPNISSLVGAIYEKGDIKRDSGFTIFYMGINLGACVAPLMCGYLGEEFGWHWGFGLAGIGMLAGIIVFWDGLKKGIFGDKGLQPKEYKDKKFLNLNIDKYVYFFAFAIVPLFAYLIFWEAEGNHFLGTIINSLIIISGVYMTYLIVTYAMKKQLDVSGKLGAIMILAVLCAIFWACFEQAGSSIIIWTDKVINLFNGLIKASETNAINPFIIIFFAIPFSMLWSKLAKIKRNPSTPVKFALGLTLLGLGFLFFGYSIALMGSGEKIPFFTLIVGWMFITFGELCLSPIGLSKVTQLSPPKIVAFMMGLWFLSSTVAHYISGFLAKETTKPIIELASGKDYEGNWFGKTIDGVNKNFIGDEYYAVYDTVYHVTKSLHKGLNEKFVQGYNNQKIIAEILQDEIDENGKKRKKRKALFDREEALKNQWNKKTKLGTKEEIEKKDSPFVEHGVFFDKKNPDHLRRLISEKDSLEHFMNMHRQIQMLEKLGLHGEIIKKLKQPLLDSDNIWSNKGMTGFLKKRDKKEVAELSKIRNSIIGDTFTLKDNQIRIEITLSQDSSYYTSNYFEKDANTLTLKGVWKINETNKKIELKDTFSSIGDLDKDHTIRSYTFVNNTLKMDGKIYKKTGEWAITEEEKQNSIDQFQCLYVLDKYGEIALKDGKRKKFDLTLYQQNYLEKSFRYKQDQFAKIKDKNENGDMVNDQEEIIVNRNQFATFMSMRYNNLYGKIGFMTILIALITFALSPVIKKLMGDVH